MSLIKVNKIEKIEKRKKKKKGDYLVVELCGNCH